jgi:hypothetical protein
MKKYRLVKEYPGSPKLATELTPKVDKENTDTNNFYWEGSWFNPNDFSEYWEEVLQKDYEILRTCPIVGTIYSVKRLSDGEVFTVGDLIKTTCKDATRIIRFQNPERNEYFIEIPTGFTRLVTIEKAKQPLFLTHDGKNIFKGDKVWYVNKKQHFYSGFIAVPGVTFRSDKSAYFLTREGAEDYISKNKVLFTTEDGYNVFDGQSYFYVGKKDLVAVRSIATSKAVGMSTSFKYFGTIGAAEKYIDSQKILFTTEDGKDIFVGDRIIWVNKDSLSHGDFTADYGSLFLSDQVAYFLSAVDAQDYIIENKPALSIKDVEKIMYQMTGFDNKAAYMKDLVKQKLGL